MSDRTPSQIVAEALAQYTKSVQVGAVGVGEGGTFQVGSVWPETGPHDPSAPRWNSAPLEPEAATA